MSALFDQFSVLDFLQGDDLFHLTLIVRGLNLFISLSIEMFPAADEFRLQSEFVPHQFLHQIGVFLDVLVRFTAFRFVVVDLPSQSFVLEQVQLALSLLFFGVLLESLVNLPKFDLVQVELLLVHFPQQFDGLFLSRQFRLERLSLRTIAGHFKQLQQMIRDIQESINLAKVAEQTERYDDMVRFIREVIKTIRSEKTVFHDEQIRLFCNAYKCKINSRRTAWRALQILYAKEANTKNRSSAIIHYYRQNIEKQIREISQEVISVIDGILKSEKLKLSIRLELYKMRGDFHRYLCEISKDSDQLKKFQKECESAYKKGIEEFKSEERRDAKQKKESQVQSYDAKRLAIYLNLSVFYYEIMLSLSKAIETCEQGFNSALQNISDLQEAKYIDSVTIMQLMHDNITAWKSEKQKGK